MYGYQGVPATRTGDYMGPQQPVLQQQPVLPTTQNVPNKPTYFNTIKFRLFGGVLALLASATLALGIADVTATIQSYCTPWTSAAPLYCSSSQEPYVWVWVASGIWASVPIFFCGLLAMCVGNNPLARTRVFALLCFLSSIVFAPAMIVLTGLELWRGGASTYTFYNYTNGAVNPGSITLTNDPYQIKFAIPAAIIAIAIVEFIMTAIVTLALCCCMRCLGIYTPNQIGSFQEATPPVIVPQGATPPVIIPIRSPRYAATATSTQVIPALAPAPASNTQFSNQLFYPPRPQLRSSSISYDYLDGQGPYNRFAAIPYPPTRWYGVSNPYGSGAMFGNPRRLGGYGQTFMQDNGPSFWQ